MQPPDSRWRRSPILNQLQLISELPATTTTSSSAQLFHHQRLSHHYDRHDGRFGWFLVSQEGHQPTASQITGQAHVVEYGGNVVVELTVAVLDTETAYTDALWVPNTDTN